MIYLYKVLLLLFLFIFAVLVIICIIFLNEYNFLCKVVFIINNMYKFLNI